MGLGYGNLCWHLVERSHLSVIHSRVQSRLISGFSRSVPLSSNLEHFIAVCGTQSAQATAYISSGLFSRDPLRRSWLARARRRPRTSRRGRAAPSLVYSPLPKVINPSCSECQEALVFAAQRKWLIKSCLSFPSRNMRDYAELA